MANRPQMVLAAVVITALAVLPATTYAGGGGSPPAPGAAAAGQSSAYCCASWTIQTPPIDKNTTTFHGTGCAFTENPNTCSTEVRKCRGEFFTPIAGGGAVTRCFSP